MQEQKDNILLYHIEQDGYPAIQYLAEAGLIGKIGLNSAGKCSTIKRYCRVQS